MTISNDQELRNALNQLTLDQQRAIGARFVSSVINLTNNERLRHVLDVAMEPDSSQEDCDDAYSVAKSIMVKTYTACGRDADWEAQAEHFVAAACTAALTPQSQLTEHFSPAWKAAIQARMASNCMMIESDSGDTQSEAEKQYAIAEDYFSA